MLNSCARESKARTGRFLGEKLISDCGLFSSYTRANKERRTGKIRAAFFRDEQGFGRVDAGSRAGFTSSRPPPPYLEIPYFCMTYGLEKLGLVDQN